MDSQPVYEVAVLGAGVVGSATAYYLASRGTRPVLLLEQVRNKHMLLHSTSSFTNQIALFEGINVGY